MASSRRKRQFPVRLNGEEQQKMAWNMTDLMKNNGIARPSTLFQDAPNSSGLGNFGNEAKVEHIPKKRQRFMAKRDSNCDDIVELKLQSNLPECWHCHIGSFRVQLRNGSHSTNTLDSDFSKTVPILCENTAEVKVTLNMESIIDNELCNDFITHGDTSNESLLPSGLRTLSMKGSTSVPSDMLLTIENLQKKGLVALLLSSKMSVFDDNWDVKVCLCEKALSKMKFASENVTVRSTDKLVKNLMKFFFEGICDDGSERVVTWNKETEFSTLYETVMRRQEEKGKMKSEKMKTFVAGNKGADEFCKLGNTCTSELKIKGKTQSIHCENFVTNMTYHKVGNCENENAILGSELQHEQKPIIAEEKHMIQPMEVHPECDELEVTGFLNSKLSYDFQHKDLKPTLRQYQRRAVQWMIDKENRSESTKDIEGDDLHVLWRRCVTLDKKVIFFNPQNGRLTTEHFKSPLLPPGGILADEMGLGKTVEVLACILNNPLPGSEMPKDDKDVKTTESKAVPVSRLEVLPESESKILSRGLVNPSESSPETVSPRTKTLSNVTEKIVPSSTSSCSSSFGTTELPSTPVQPLVTTLESSCTSILPLFTAAPSSVISSIMLETPSVSCITELPSTSVKPLVTTSVSPCTSILSSFTVAPSCVISSTPLETPSVSCITELPSTSVKPTFTTLESPCTSSLASVTAARSSVIPSTKLETPSASIAPSDITTVLPSATPIQLLSSSTVLHSTSLTASSTTSMPPSVLSTTPSVALSSSQVSSNLPTTTQKLPLLPQSSTTEVLPTLAVFPTRPSQKLSCPSSGAHLTQSSETQVSAESRISGNMKLNTEMLPPEVENLPATEKCHSSLLHCPENSANVSASVDETGLSPSLGTAELVSVPKSVNAKVASSAKTNCLVNDGTPKVSAVDNGSEASTRFIKCICGSTRSSIDDVLLKCTECLAVSHASCLGYSVTYQQTEAFFCPNCAVNKPPIPSRATLIISPATIAHQWVEEITRHTTPSALRLLVYEGVAKQGFVQPDMLADHDVILTTYATLRADFNHLGTQQGRSLRYQKRYMALPSPLTAIKFWRICLDEAQMVESTTAKAAEMALRLVCVNRWCVTGTPIQKGLEDLYGLLLFLGVFPYCQKVWWNRLLYEPYLRGNKEPMYNALADILWRTAKKNVLDEINLPSQTEIVVRLNFTPVEEHFYRRQHEECSATINLMLRRFGSQDIKLNSLDRNTVHRMLIPLLRLRQACCHPQVVRGGFLSMQKSTMTMDQLLEVLITRAKLECEEAHRQLLFAINGLAGIHAIKEEWPEAVELYRQSMRSWVEHEDKFRTDALQKLHTLHNLSDLLSAVHPGCSRTLRDDKLKDEAEELVKQYMKKPNAQVQAAIDHLTGCQTNIEELLKKVQFQTPWWLIAVDSVAASGLGHDLINRVKEELSAVSTDHGSILNSFTDIHGLGYTVTTKLDVVESTHSTLVQALDQLRSYPTPEMVHATAVCCLRSRPRRTSQATKCKFCEVDDIFTEYESRLFGHQGMKGIIEEDEARNIDWHRHGNTGGLRAETETEKVLKTLFAFIKSHRLVPSVHQDARNHLAFTEARRKEFKFLRSVWFASRERVSSLDELEMCTTKLRLALPGETVNDDEKHVIHQGQVEQQKLKFISDRIIARTELRKKLGQYLYLTNLAKSQKFDEGENPDPCPVCTKNLGKEWSVFSCGHCYCCQCVWVLLRQAGIGPRNRDVHIKCPICRFPTLAREISYVCTGKDSSYGDNRIFVKGSHSTKVEAVVRALLKIKVEDGTAKCLVFSTWQDVLELIGKALQENDINFRHITCGGKRFQTDLHVFKENPDVPVLLLPLQSGSNGLNIIEATHVLLVEPALNPAHELQAVGRVHRIGQTRPTFVHRFIINNTVESRMYTLLNGKSRDVVRTGSKDTENTALTIADLTSLFKDGSDAIQKGVDSDHQRDDIEMIT